MTDPLAKLRIGIGAMAMGAIAMTLTGCLEDTPGTVQHALAATTKAERCERLAYLSDERVMWVVREKARARAYEIGCLAWKATAS